MSSEDRKNPFPSLPVAVYDDLDLERVPSWSTDPLERLCHAVRSYVDARQPIAGAIFIRGAYGSGKTHALREVSRIAYAGRVTTLYASALPDGSWIRSLLSRLPTERLREVLALHRQRVILDYIASKEIGRAHV